MKNTVSYIAALLLGMSSASVVASENEKELISLDYNTFYDTQVLSSDCGGYWDERRVRVCDYRTELTDVSYKNCHYKLMYAHANTTYPEWEVKTVLASQSCPLNWTIGGQNNYAPGGVYIHQYNTFFTQQESRRVEYNCRWETRTVWVPRTGGSCHLNPN